MGLAASQARLLVLTARKSDLEFRAQEITNRKLLLATQTENLAMDYTRALSNRQLKFVFDYNSNELQDINEDLSYDGICAQNSAFIGQYRVVLANGRIAVPDVSYIPYNIATASDGSAVDGTYSGLTSSQIDTQYGKLGTAVKIGYLAEALTALTSAYTAGTITDTSTKEALAQKVTSDGTPLVTRNVALGTVLDSVYESASKTRTTTAESVTTATTFTADDAKNLTDAQKKVIKALATDTKGTPAAAQSTFSAEGTDEEYANAINKLNTYYTEKSAEGNDWLNANVSSNITESTILTDETSSQTYNDYLAALAKGYDANELPSTSTTSQKNNITNADLTEFLTTNAETAKNLICYNSSFSNQLSQEETTATVSTSGSTTTVTCSDGNTYVVLPALKNNQFFQNALREGSILIEKQVKNDDGTKEWTTESWASSSLIQDKLYTEDDALAEAEYETQTAIIQSQDKMLDVQLKQVETQQKACENEIESVKKILDKNIEKACKYMS